MNNAKEIKEYNEKINLMRIDLENERLKELKCLTTKYDKIKA